MKLHLPQFRWPFRSTADRYAKDYLAEERSGSGMRAWSLASCHLAIVNDRLEAKKLEQRVSALERTWDYHHGKTTRLTADSGVEAATPPSDPSPSTETDWDPRSSPDFETSSAHSTGPATRR